MLRRLPLVLGTILVLACSAFSAVATATTAYDQATGISLPVGSSFNAQSSGNVVLSGALFGFPVVWVCTGSTMTGTVAHDPDAASLPSLAVSTWTFSGCANSSGNPCTWTTTDLKWWPNGSLPAGYHSAMAGLLATSTTAMALGTGTTGTVTFPAGCVSPSQPACPLQGGTPGPLGSADQVTNYMAGAWSGAAPQLSVSSAPIMSATPGCFTGGQLSFNFTLRTGATVGAGDLIGLR